MTCMSTARKAVGSTAPALPAKLLPTHGHLGSDSESYMGGCTAHWDPPTHPLLWLQCRGGKPLLPRMGCSSAAGAPQALPQLLPAAQAPRISGFPRHIPAALPRGQAGLCWLLALVHGAVS